MSAKRNVNYKGNTDTDDKLSQERTVDGKNSRPGTTIEPKKLNVKIKCKNEEQKNFIRLIEENDIVFCNGPSGCGKTHLSVMKALNYLSEDNAYKRIVIITPFVESSRRSLGYLSGDFNSKVSVYVNSIFRLFDDAIGIAQRTQMCESGLIEVMNVGYLRGENLKNCIVLIDESQNFDEKEMLTLLTRISSNAKFILSGDIQQIDFTKNKEESGLYRAMNKLVNIDGIGIFTFSSDSIVRHGLIKKIIDNY